MSGCCDGTVVQNNLGDLNITEEEIRVYESVKNFYSKLESGGDLKTSACSATSKPHPIICRIIRQLPDEISTKFYGCGNPVPLGIEGLSVLDLGSGAGRDCYIAAKLVGPNGHVTGIDMTPELLDIARTQSEEYTTSVLNYPHSNLSFIQGYIEHVIDAGVKPNSIDLAISNCVITLSPNKKKILSGVYQVLKQGGEFFFSDMVCDRRVPQHLKGNEMLHGEGIAGALYIGDYIKLCKQVGFRDPRILSSRPLTVNREIQDMVGEAKFYSVTFRLFKVSEIEDAPEDYGQMAIYQGTIEGYAHSYVLDSSHKFETGKPVLVSGNTASMLIETWLSKYFEVIGSRDVHYGSFLLDRALCVSSFNQVDQN